jgi:hypothetical protein
MPRKILILALLLGGCGTAISYTPVADIGDDAEPKHGSEVDVYMSGPPDRPYRDVGLLEAEQETDLSLDDTREMLRKLRRKAGAIGCDAIYLNAVGSKAAPMAGFDFRYTDSVKTLAATCIRYTRTGRGLAQRDRRQD